MDAFWVIIVVIVLFIMWIQGGGPARSKEEGLFKTVATSTTSSIHGDKTGSTGGDIYSRDSSAEAVSTESKYKGQVHLQGGTAASTFQPNQEYITLYAQGNETPISLKGWSLRNGRGDKLTVVSGNTVRSQSTVVEIPSLGIALYDPYHPQNNRLTSITLKSGESAIITTGRPPVFSGVTINNNFKTNRCLGYLEDDPSYRAYPSLSYNCPSSDDIPGVTYLDDVCYNFARSIRSCHTPKDVYVEDEGYCLDGDCQLSSYCRDFIKKNYNFATCFALYSEDEDFVDSEWRIFLNQNWELWADRRESISLFDSTGKLVDKISY